MIAVPLAGAALEAVAAAAFAGLAAAAPRADEARMGLFRDVTLFFAKGEGGFRLEPASRAVVILRNPPEAGVEVWLGEVVQVHCPGSAPFTWPTLATRHDEIARHAVFGALALDGWLAAEDRAALTESLLATTPLCGPEVETRAAEAMIRAGDRRWDHLGGGKLDPAQLARLAVLTRLELLTD